MYTESGVTAPKGTRAYSTSRRALADPAANITPPAAAAAAPPATPAAMFGAPAGGAAAAGSVVMPSWLSQSAAPAAGGEAAAAGSAALPAGSLFAAPVSVTATHIVHVRLTPNNTICTLTALNGDTKCWTSSGSVGFKNSKKSTYMACIAAGEQLGLKAKQHNIRNVDMNIAGFHKNKRAVLKGLIKAGLNIVAIRDTTPIPFNGCKPRKVRRL
jgi:small subunit ribosomal protein S11